MKNKSLFQFSLSALFTMVLAACGSNGGNNDVPTTTATPTITPTPVVETNTTATTPAPEQKTEKPVENVDAQKLDVQPAESAFVGYKHVSKNNSRFLINEDTDGSKPHSADVPVGMNLRNLSPVMDTLVVAEPTMPDENGKMKVGYLEDLDFRTASKRADSQDDVARQEATTGYGSTGFVPPSIAITNQKNGTFPFMIINQQRSGKNQEDEDAYGNVRQLLSGRWIGGQLVDTFTEDSNLANLAYRTNIGASLNEYYDPRDADLTYKDFVEQMAEQARLLAVAKNNFETAYKGVDKEQRWNPLTGDWDRSADDIRADVARVETPWVVAQEAYLRETSRLKARCYNSGNKACEEQLEVNYSEKSNRTPNTNEAKHYTIHVADSNVGRNGNTRIDDETNNEKKSEFRSWSHMGRNNNTKSRRKAVDENKQENQYYAYTYQTNRTNYTDETMPIGMMAIPTYGLNGELTGFKYVNTSSEYNTAGAIGSENLARKSRTDIKLADENETASSKLSGTEGAGRNGTVAKRDKNVAEIYGYRTFPAGANGYNIGEKVEDYKLNNLPLENKQLTKVQYGRVTSALSGHSTFDDFREGLKLDPTGKLETYVVSYGVFGQDGTEDHYFYRGIDSITPEQLKDLSAKTAGVLKYWGHAVSYGLDDKWDGNPESNVAPTAIGNTTVGRFVSGNHAHAVVDLKSGDVHGSIYNSWYNQDVADEARRAGNTDPKAGLYAVDLVKFNGRLATNGNISGTSVYQKDGSTGLFGANLYGSDASEIGGIVASDDKNKNKKWGAVFGGVRVGGGEIQNATNRGGL